MGRHLRLVTAPPASSLFHSPQPPVVDDLIFSPFGKLDGLDTSNFCEAAYEFFFSACRSSPGFGRRTALSYHNEYQVNGSSSSAPGSPVKPPGVGMAVTSRIKASLGLKMLKRSPSSPCSSTPSSRRTRSCGVMNPSSPGRSMAGSSSPQFGSGGGSSSPRFTVPQLGSRMMRPMTSSEIMRQQMRVTDESDNRLRKTLMRTLVGQMGRRAETIILPLELLRHLKPSEFLDAQEYHSWHLRSDF